MNGLRTVDRGKIQILISQVREGVSPLHVVKCRRVESVRSFDKIHLGSIPPVKGVYVKKTEDYGEFGEI
jgi:hypothetical protein